MYPLRLTNFLTNIPIKTGKAGVKGAGVIRAHKVSQRAFRYIPHDTDFPIFLRCLLSIGKNKFDVKLNSSSLINYRNEIIYLTIDDIISFLFEPLLELGRNIKLSKIQI